MVTKGLISVKVGMISYYELKEACGKGCVHQIMPKTGPIAAIAVHSCEGIPSLGPGSRAKTCPIG